MQDQIDNTLVIVYCFIYSLCAGELMAQEDRFKKILTCPCGLRSSEVNSSNMGGMHIQTNFMPIMSNSGHVTWLCSSCYERAHKLALELHEIVKDEHLFFLNLLRPPTVVR